METSFNWIPLLSGLQMQLQLYISQITLKLFAVPTANITAVTVAATASSTAAAVTVVLLLPTSHWSQREQIILFS